jgi:hypothetical protein
VAQARVCAARNFFDSDAKWATPGLSEMWDSDCLGDRSGQHNRSQTRLMECVSSCGKSQDNYAFDSTTTFDRLMQGWLRWSCWSCWSCRSRWSRRSSRTVCACPFCFSAVAHQPSRLSASGSNLVLPIRAARLAGLNCQPTYSTKIKLASTLLASGRCRDAAARRRIEPATTVPWHNDTTTQRRRQAGMQTQTQLLYTADGSPAT